MAEVVIALAVTALVFGLALRALSGGFDRLRKDENTMRALLVAQSTLDRVGYDLALSPAGSSGSTADGFSWTVQAAPYGAEAAAAAPLVGYVVRVTVAWKERSNDRQVRLTTVRLARPGGAS